MAPGVEIVVDPPEGLARLLARRIEDVARAAVARRGSFSLAIPGGSVATSFLPVLAAAPIPWEHGDVFFTDERAVPPAHPDSNEGLARALLLRGLSVPPRLHPARAGGGSIDDGARRYEEALLSVLGTPPAIDVLLLGVGPDGHVCSLFPGHAALEERARLAVGIGDSPKPPPLRITLTLAALASARLLVVAAFGAAKAAVVREGLEDERSMLPLALAVRAGPPVLALLDAGAAGALAASGRP